MGEKLRAARVAAGMTQVQLAEKVNVQQRDISRWENGLREPGVLIVKAMAQALGCSMDDLV
jgi:transcriptional regulator with XRE-family HTH domain